MDYKLLLISNDDQRLIPHFINFILKLILYIMMTKKTALTTKELLKFNNEDFKRYIFLLQDILKEKLDSGASIDEILDKEDPFETLEPFLSEEVYPILVLAMINNIRTETVMQALTEGFNKGRDDYNSKQK